MTERPARSRLGVAMMQSGESQPHRRRSAAGVLGSGVLALVLFATATAASAGAEEAPPEVTSEQTTASATDSATAASVEFNTQYVDPMVTAGGAGGEDDAQRAYERR